MGLDMSESAKEAGAREENIIPDQWHIAYLYDGACPVCQGLKKMLLRTDSHHNIAFVNLARDDYDATKWGVPREDALLKIHAVLKNGEVHLGTDAGK